MLRYTKDELEKKCYDRCKVAGWNLKRIGVLVVDDIHYSKKRMLKHAKDYVQKMLEQDPNNLVFQNEYDLLNGMVFSKFEKEYTDEQIEKKCYDRCKKVDWNYDAIQSLNCCGIIYTSDAVFRYAKKYMKKYEPKDMDLKEILFFLNDKYFFNKEFNAYYCKAIIQSVNENSELKNNINFSYIYEHSAKFNMDAIKMYCYDHCKGIKWQYHKIGFLSINGVKYDSMMIWNFAKEYMLKYKPDCMDLKEILFFLDKDGYDFYDKYQDIVNLILNKQKNFKNKMNYSWVKEHFKAVIFKYCFDVCEKYQWEYQTIIKYCMDYSISFHSLMDLAIGHYQFLSVGFNESQKANYQRYIMLYINKYMDSDFQMCVQKYLEGGHDNVEDFCKCNNLYENTFCMYLNLLKDANGELFCLDSGEMENLYQQNRIEAMNRVKKIIELIENGVVEDDVKRDFDLLDYYFITSLNFNKFLEVIGDTLTASDYKVLRTFFVKYKNDQELGPRELNSLYTLKVVLGVKFDSQGRIISDFGRVVTLEEKKGIVNYLKMNHIPVTHNTYQIAFRRWANGLLSIDNRKVSIRIK